MLQSAGGESSVAVTMTKNLKRKMKIKVLIRGLMSISFISEHGRSGKRLDRESGI